MAYIDSIYYNDVFKGVPVDEELLQRLIVRASRDIDVLTRFTITDFENMHTSIRDKVKLATAMQVEHLNEYGEMASSDASNDGGGFRIGSYSESGSGSSGASGDAWSGSYPSNVLDVLFQTGLLYRGVSAYG